MITYKTFYGYADLRPENSIEIDEEPQLIMGDVTNVERNDRDDLDVTDNRIGEITRSQS